MYNFPPKNTKLKNQFSDVVKTGFGFAKKGGFTGFPVFAKTGFHSLVGRPGRALKLGGGAKSDLARLNRAAIIVGNEAPV